MLRFTFNLLLIFFTLGITGAAGLAWYVIPQLPEIETLKDVRMQVPLRVYSEDHSLIAEFGEQRRIPVSLDQVPDTMIKAILAAEDNRFYQHPGVDWQGILRASLQLIKTGEKTQGGSTITMQVARNFFLTREKTYLRKLNEIFLAFKIEKELSKDDILSLYLNKIYLGQRAYGVAAAAQVYYGLPLDELTLPQYAMLAGLPKAPSTTNPVTNPTRALERRNYVLQRMVNEGFISPEEYQSVINAPVTARLHSPAVELEAPYVAEMVRQDLIEKYGDDTYTSGLRVVTTIKDRNQVAANDALRVGLLDYDERHGYRGPEHHYDLGSDMNEETWKSLLQSFPFLGNLYPALIVSVKDQTATAYLVNTGLIKIEWPGLSWARRYISENYRGAAPKNAAEVVQAGDIVRLSKNATGAWKLAQIPDVEGGLVSMRPSDGATLAMAGGFDFQRSKFNRITQATRQPGSAFKPFIYSSALDAGYTAASLINDAPVVFEDPGIEDVWRPENYSRQTYGPTRLREALTHSRNLVSIRLLHSIGIPFAMDYIARFGFDIERLPKNLSLALGSGTVTPWELSRAFCVFANGGYLIDPYFIRRIYTEAGETLFEANPAVACPQCEPATGGGSFADNTGNMSSPEPGQIHYAKQVVDSENVWIMNSIMRDVVLHGTARRALELNRKDISGKTGTTNDQRDAWFSGFNSQLIAVSWVGFDKFLPLGSAETGSRAALPIWIDYMRTALENMPESILDRPPGLVFARIDPQTGKLAPPESTNAIFEVFSSKYTPKEITDSISGTGKHDGETSSIQDIF
jgi:penicillin-binding protein 1A